MGEQDSFPPPPKHDGIEIPPGIWRSRMALKRDLPELLANRRLYGQWVAYHGTERIGISRRHDDLIRECLRRGLQPEDYYIGVIEPVELIDEEDLDYYGPVKELPPRPPGS